MSDKDSDGDIEINDVDDVWQSIVNELQAEIDELNRRIKVANKINTKQLNESLAVQEKLVEALQMIADRPEYASAMENGLYKINRTAEYQLDVCKELSRKVLDQITKGEKE